jgi:mannose-6-phosphate isomerase-like protein (cupin superfamily)
MAAPEADGPRLVRSLADHRFLPLGEDEGYDHDPRDEGLVCELISRARSGSQDIGLGVGRMLPGQYHIRHHHPDGSEFYYFLSGECTVHLDGEDVRARPGTAIYIPPGCVHSVRNDTDGVVELLYGLSKPEYEEIGHAYDE